MNLDSVSERPGVYLWKDINNNIIYIGKAKCLKKRMSQYFSGTINSFKTIKMVQKIAAYETIICNNETEALILERNLIQKYKPFYNICLLDDKKYPYINLLLNDKELLITLKYNVRSENKHNVYFGPYSNNGGSKQILDFLKSEYLFRDGLPIKNEKYDFWESQFLLAKQILSKSNDSFVKALTKKMMTASDREQYEIANNLKNVIKFLSFQKELQIVELKTDINFDVIVGINYGNFIFFGIHFYRNGLLQNSDVFLFEIIVSEKESIRQFINQFYKNKQIPKKIITNLKINDNDIYFDTNILIPKKGKFFYILNLCKENAKQNMDLKIMEYKQKENVVNNGLAFLRNITKIENADHIIMIDNSNTGTKNPVSVIVSYRKGFPETNEYRKFNVVVNNRNGDVEYMRQGIEKYFENENDIPNILIVDGGIQQLNEVKKTLKKLLINNVKIVGLVKNDKHKTEYVCLENGNKISVEGNAYYFLSGMQEEVDRFAKVSHRNKNLKTSLEGKLINIKGIGYKTELKILRHFKTYNNIYNASVEELEEVVSKKVANMIIINLK